MSREDEVMSYMLVESNSSQGGGRVGRSCRTCLLRATVVRGGDESGG